MKSSCFYLSWRMSPWGPSSRLTVGLFQMSEPLMLVRSTVPIIAPIWLLSKPYTIIDISLIIVTAQSDITAGTIEGYL